VPARADHAIDEAHPPAHLRHLFSPELGDADLTAEEVRANYLLSEAEVVAKRQRLALVPDGPPARPRITPPEPVEPEEGDATTEGAADLGLLEDADEDEDEDEGTRDDGDGDGDGGGEDSMGGRLGFRPHGGDEEGDWDE